MNTEIYAEFKTKETCKLDYDALIKINVKNLKYIQRDKKKEFNVITRDGKAYSTGFIKFIVDTK